MGYLSRGRRAARARSLRAFSIYYLIALLAPTPAAAQAVRLQWIAPSSCPSAHEVETKVGTFLGGRPQDARGAVNARVRIEHRAGRYRLSLTLSSEAHHAARVLHAKSCAELGETAAWLIALAIDPTLPAPRHQTEDQPSPPHIAEAGSEGTRVSEASSAAEKPSSPRDSDKKPLSNTKPASPPKSAVQNAPRAPEPPANAPDAASKKTAVTRVAEANAPPAPPQVAGPPLPRAVYVGASAGVFDGTGVGAQPSLDLFTGLALGGSYSQVRLAGLLPRSVDIAPGAEARVWALQVSVQECALWGKALRAGPCLSLAGLRTVVNVHGLTHDTNRISLWASGGAGFQVLWRLRKYLALSFAATAGIPVSPRPRFTVAPLGPVITTQTWSADGRIGLAFAYP